MPGYSYTQIGGASYGRPLSGTEIINRVIEIGARYTDGRDYSKVKRIGMGFSRFSIDIKAEYEKYIKNVADPLGYELFANVCGPYWEADLRADTDAKISEFCENAITAASLATIIYGGVKQFDGLNISFPGIDTGGLASSADIGSIFSTSAIQRGFVLTGAGTANAVTVNAEAFGQLAAACNERFGNLFYQVFGDSGGGVGSGSSGNVNNLTHRSNCPKSK